MTHARVRALSMKAHGSPTNTGVLLQLVIEFKDVRIIALGVLSKPRSSFSINSNARLFLHPPGITKGEEEETVPSDAASEGSDTSSQYALDAPATVRHPLGTFLRLTWFSHALNTRSEESEGHLPRADPPSSFPMPCKVSLLHSRRRR